MNDENDRPKVTGKALRVNDNSADDRDQSSSSPKQGPGDRSRKVSGNGPAGKRQQCRGRGALARPQGMTNAAGTTLARR